MTGMSGRRVGLIAIVAVALLAVAAVAWITARQFCRSQELAPAVAALEAQNRDLRAQAQELIRNNEALRARLAELGETQPPPPPRILSGASNLDQARLLVKLQADLAAAQNTTSELQARLQEIEADLARASQENQRLAAAEQELKESLAGEKRLLEAVQNELKTSNNRLLQTEASNLILHRQNRELSDKLAAAGRLLGELEEINRRRENYLTAILRRYRELTEQLRTLALRPEAGETRGLDAAEISRLQSAVAMTEEDLRQLGNLNNQAAQLQRKLAER